MNFENIYKLISVFVSILFLSSKLINKTGLIKCMTLSEHTSLLNWKQCEANAKTKHISLCE